MFDEERARILRMVAEGKLSPEEAADLLEALQPRRESNQPAPVMPPEPPSLPGQRRRSRTVVIQIKEGGESKVDLRIPLSLAKAAGKFIPRKAQESLQSRDINILDFLEDAAEAESGTILQVKDGEDRVLIAVE
ncbi:MAG TPA: hypothetical protein VKX16_16575 [Chloroflexota bacterium]|nr:hypothetical protein [Chloroflexota bacterium]